VGPLSFREAQHGTRQRGVTLVSSGSNLAYNQQVAIMVSRWCRVNNIHVQIALDPSRVLF